MISIITDANEFSLSRNPIGFLIESDKYIDNAGSSPGITFNQDSALLETQSFIFPIKVFFEQYMIMAGYNTDNSGIIPPGDDLEAIAEAFRNNYIISKYYNVEVDGIRLTFTYKNTKPSGISPDNIIPPASFSIEGGSAGSVRTFNNYSVFAILMFEEEFQSNNYIPYELLFDFDDNAQCLVQINEIINSLISGFDLPDFNQNSISKCLYSLRRYYLRFSEYDNDNQTPLKLYNSDIKYILKGKRDFIENKETSLNLFISGSKNFLYSGPLEKYTTKKAQEYLYFLNTNGVINLRLKFLIYYTDGTSEETYYEYGEIEDNCIYLIPASYLFILTTVIPAGKIIYKYIVELERTAFEVVWVSISKEITYLLKKSFPEEQQFLFQNEFGVFETIIATGTNKKTLNIETEINKRYLKSGYTIKDGEFFASDKESFQNFNSYTGFKSKEEAEHLEKMLRANKFFYADNEKEIFIPCILTSSSVESVNNSEYIFSLNFEYRYAYND